MIMVERICLVGLDEPEYTDIQNRLDMRVVAYEMLPQIMVKEGQLLVESNSGARMLPVSKVVFQGIFEDDLDFITALALWGGPCLPNPRGMMDCRLKFPCLVRALAHTRFGSLQRGYAGPRVSFESQIERVAKWGNWHCGENKARFTETWQSEEACIIENFLPGQAVRIVIIGEQYWQIGLEGDSWLKSIHASNASFMAVDEELLADTRTIQKAIGLEIVANDYIITKEGSKHLLEVNHIPNVTRFPEIWEAYRNYVLAWANDGLQ
ncbi:MAG: hypothetical protein DRR16_08975 [Candidatus Parabeggiatoa sp. nov. 3]|nr:MAG: hypothetical protein DRR00_01235 [Gammaproteobacteria bacterium]RKZ60975.1 MAG: hypothetical protein DRQ99_21215 [Gammaproteobacteria bacterium]RKZ86737.1 MAG: hypothetical protein DRR16_08975 [Gammaproteobacteria bacterium]